MSLEQYDYRTVTWEVAKEFTRVENDAFKDDVVFKAFLPPEQRFGDSVLPSIADFEQLRARVSLFEKLTMTRARWRYTQVKSDPRERLFLLKEGSRYVAGAHWVLPKYLVLPKLGLVQRVTLWCQKLYFIFLNWITWLRTDNPISSTGIESEFRWGSENLGGDDTEERWNELRDLDLKLLKETTYPKDHCYYLQILCVRSDAHGKGYGKRIIKDSLKQLAPYHAPPNLVGPAKATLFAAPTARKFYIGLGWSLGATGEHELANKIVIPHTYFFLNLHSDPSERGSEQEPKH